MPSCEICGSKSREHAIDCPNRIRMFRLDGHLEDRTYRLWDENDTHVRLSLNKLSANPFWVDRKTFEECYIEITE